MWEDKYICHKCVNDKYVMQHIIKTGNNFQICSYCKRKRKNIHLKYILKMMNEVFEYYYDIYEDIYDSGRGDSAQDVIYGELGVEWDWICPYISRHLLSLNPLQARCRRYSRGER